MSTEPIHLGKIHCPYFPVFLAKAKNQEPIYSIIIIYMIKEL
jgi:hypothetical protein